MHAYWDQGLGIFSENNHIFYHQDIEAMATDLMQQYPRSYFTTELKRTTPEQWSQESFDLAKRVAYAIPEDTVPMMMYNSAGKTVVELQVVLAGYRLADILNQGVLS